MKPNKFRIIFIRIDRLSLLNAKEYTLVLFNLITFSIMFSLKDGVHISLGFGVHRISFNFTIHQWLANYGNTIVNGKDLFNTSNNKFKLSPSILFNDGYYYLCMQKLTVDGMIYRIANNNEVLYNGFEELTDAQSRLAEEFNKLKEEENVENNS